MRGVADRGPYLGVAISRAGIIPVIPLAAGKLAGEIGAVMGPAGERRVEMVAALAPVGQRDIEIDRDRVDRRMAP